jgi:arylformamidase
MKLIDISRPVQEAPIYPGGSPVQVEQLYDMSKGDPFNASKITAGSHMGTHADASRHFLKDSNVGIDKMDLNFYYGPCRVLTVPDAKPITKEVLEGRLEGCERLVIHSGGHSYLTKEAADYIVDKGVKTIVTDAWSIAPLDNETEIHVTVLAPGLAVVENVVLDGVEDGDYILCAFPIKISGCDGAPVRAVLIAEG